MNIPPTAEKETRKSLKMFQLDRGGGFTSGAFKAFLDEKGIKQEVMNAYTPQENGISECTNQTLNNIARYRRENPILPSLPLYHSFRALAVSLSLIHFLDIFGLRNPWEP